MTTEKMNVHQALAELKTINKRINDVISAGPWIVSNKHSNKKIEGVPISEYADSVKTRYQKVTDLIKRAEAIKRAVVISNAVTKVTVGDVEYTVAEAIDMKDVGIPRLRGLMRDLNSDYLRAKNALEIGNGMDLERRADNYVSSIVGNSDTKGMTEEITRMREDFIKAQTLELVDPIDVVKELEALGERIDSFTMNVDAALSVSNALTIIEVSY